MDQGNKPSSLQGNKYEVLLSYSRDEDTQESFVSRLRSCLREAGIYIPEDDISIELLPSILEGSEISIIIFSKHYASSRRCLEELTKIMEFNRAHDHVVVPIFHGVDLSEVRKVESSFGQSFRDLIQRISPTLYELSRWGAALIEAGHIRGFQSNNGTEVIPKIVKSVLHMLGRGWDLVGVRSKVKDVITILDRCESKGVASIVIWGMGGIGKTTLAKAIFDHIQHKFEITCFLEDVRETWRRNGQVDLQTRLLSKICNETSTIIEYSIESVRFVLKRRPCHKKVLVVVDDVDDMEQLKALCGSREWFGEGSRIIITTRDKHLLRAFQVGYVYEVGLLNHDESLELFSRTAFKQACLLEGEFKELSKRVVTYAGGLPLALKVLGSFLVGRNSMEWKSTLRKLSTYTHPDLYNTLKLSFDSLDGDEKEIFINIVSLYIGEDRDDVIQKLDGHGCNASIAIRALEDRGLVTINENNKLGMHDLLKEMGRQIIRETSQNDLRNRGHRYDVFLSFRSEDIRTTFTSHLYTALYNAGINVFKDDGELRGGNHINPMLLQTIGSSKISIIIFSRDYAGSGWCLEELSTIMMELHKSNNQEVLLMFYNVDPSEIHYEISSVGEAFKDLVQSILPSKGQVSKWSTALAEAGRIAGIVLLGSMDKSEDVKAFVQRVRDILYKKHSFVTKHLVGVDNRVKEVIKMLQNRQSKDVVMVGIWGMGGSGKTTIANVIYNEIGATFESRSYLSNIRQVWHQEKDQVRLQNQLLSEICNTKEMWLNSVESGKIILRDRLRYKKALVVLDDVDKFAQLKALVGGYDWFKRGSRIIITTRNQRLLHEMGCAVYAVENLDEVESLKLFSWHAFEQESPKKDFTELSRHIVAYSGGLPLALEILGSYLFGRELEEWNSVLEKLKKIPNDNIQKQLKLSFDDLNDLDKEIFLDIACFFIGMDRNDVTQILNGCGWFAHIGITTLVERSLVTIDENNKLGMHDLLRDMGREIIRKQSQNKLGKRSRLWFHEDAHDVLSEDMGTEAIEGLSLQSHSAPMHFQTEAFKMMKRLRLLRLQYVQLKGNYKYISRELRWLCWRGFPLEHIPSNFYAQKLVAIDLKYSSLRQVWMKPLLLKRLKILNLSHSHYLVQTPDFSNLPNLEKLILKDCPSLSMIHHSIGLLHNLLLLNLKDCIGLSSLPRGIYRLKCLKTLNLSGCKSIEKLEEDIEQMESMTSLIAPTIRQGPFSLVRLKSILYLSVCGYEGLAHHVIPSLYWSWVSLTNNPQRFILTYAGMPPSILWDMLKRIHDPSTIPRSELKPQSLLLEDGVEIPDSLCATNYMDVSRLEKSLAQLLIQIGKNIQVFCTLSEKISQGLNLTKYSGDCVLPGDNYPYWLTFKGEGISVKFKVPPVNGRDHLKGIAICCVYIPLGDLGNKARESLIIGLMITNYTKRTTLVYMEDKLNSLEEAEKEIISNLESDDQVKFKVIFGNGFTVKKTAVYLIFGKPFETTNLTGSNHEREEKEEAHQSIRPTKTKEAHQSIRPTKTKEAHQSIRPTKTKEVHQSILQR